MDDADPPEGRSGQSVGRRTGRSTPPMFVLRDTDGNSFLIG